VINALTVHVKFQVSEYATNPELTTPSASKGLWAQNGNILACNGVLVKYEEERTNRGRARGVTHFRRLSCSAFH
jgi:hypothetical protein